MSTPKLARLVPQTASVADEVLHMSSFGIIRQQGKVLLLRRLRPEFSAGKWTLPASLINFGEDPGDAMKRICMALLGVEPTSVKLLDVQSYGDKHWDFCLVYIVDLPKIGRLSPDIEKSEYFEISHLPQDLRDDHREVLQTLLDRKLL